MSQRIKAEATGQGAQGLTSQNPARPGSSPLVSGDHGGGGRLEWMIPYTSQLTRTFQNPSLCSVRPQEAGEPPKAGSWLGARD